eukprot:scaffold275350_cov21-Prasinocladus_malaysianus.AAC.1
MYRAVDEFLYQQRHSKTILLPVHTCSCGPRLPRRPVPGCCKQTAGRAATGGWRPEERPPQPKGWPHRPAACRRRTRSPGAGISGQPATIAPSHT